MLCNLYWWKRTSVHCNYSFRRHRWFRLTKNWAWFINHVAGDGAAQSVLRMILICCIIMYWIWRVIPGGPFRGPLVPSQTRCFEGATRSFRGQAPSGPLVIRPLLLVISNRLRVVKVVYECHLIGPRDIAIDKHLTLTAIQPTALNTASSLVVPIHPPAAANTSTNTSLYSHMNKPGQYTHAIPHSCLRLHDSHSVIKSVSQNAGIMYLG